MEMTKQTSSDIHVIADKIRADIRREENIVFAAKVACFVAAAWSGFEFLAQRGNMFDKNNFTVSKNTLVWNDKLHAFESRGRFSAFVAGCCNIAGIYAARLVIQILWSIPVVLVILATLGQSAAVPIIAIGSLTWNVLNYVFATMDVVADYSRKNKDLWLMDLIVWNNPDLVQVEGVLAVRRCGFKDIESYLMHVTKFNECRDRDRWLWFDSLASGPQIPLDPVNNRLYYDTVNKLRSYVKKEPIDRNSNPTQWTEAKARECKVNLDNIYDSLERSRLNYCKPKKTYEQIHADYLALIELGRLQDAQRRN